MDMKSHTRAQVEFDNSSPPKHSTRSTAQGVHSSLAMMPNRETRPSGIPRGEPQQMPKGPQTITTTRTLLLPWVHEQANAPRVVAEEPTQEPMDHALQERMQTMKARCSRRHSARALESEEHTRSPTLITCGDGVSRQLSLPSVSTGVEHGTQRSSTLFGSQQPPQEAGTSDGEKSQGSTKWSTLREIVISGRLKTVMSGCLKSNELVLAIVNNEAGRVQSRAEH